MEGKRSRDPRGSSAPQKAPQLERMEAIGKVVGDVAHDFNNLLLAIMAADHLLLDRIGEDDPRRRYALDIERACERASVLTRKLLAFSRKQALRPTVVDLNVVATDVLPMLEHMTGDTVRIVTHLEPTNLRVRVDRAQMEHVVQELVSNARDAMPDGGTIELRTRAVDPDSATGEEVSELDRDASYVCLSVVDSGCGMDDEMISGLFDPFFTTKHEGQRAGLGLSAVYGTVKQSGGVLTVASEPGQGSTFNVYLPGQEDLSQSSTEAAAAVGSLLGTETILIVEDEAIVHDLCHEILSEYGYTLLHAHNGKEALSASERHRGEIDLVVTDVVMPGMSGKQVAKALRKQRKGLRVLFMSGYAARGERKESPDPSIGFLAKPFSPVELATRVRELLNG